MTQEEKTNSIPEFSKGDFIPSGVVNGHEYVDMGLPSGLKWATCNIGASSPEEYGDYFAWGETKPKDSYDFDSYDFANPNSRKKEYYLMNSYNEDDDFKELIPEDDAAITNWKGPWRIPSIEEFQELIDECELTWGIYNGTSGVKVKGPNGSSIFLPAASTTEESCYGEEGAYWSSCLDDDTCEFDASTDYWDYYRAQNMSFDENGSECGYSWREIGNSIRPVCLINNAN